MSFSYKGYDDETLQRLSSPKEVFPGVARIVYPITEFYSLGRIIRSWSGFPSYLPLYVYALHGTIANIRAHEIENDAEAMLVFNSNHLREYKSLSSKPCYQLTYPYVTYRQSHNIKQSSAAQGTLALPSHSSMDVSASFDVKAYADMLKALPGEFQPVGVALHVADVRLGLHIEFIKQGLPVFTAGHPQNFRFIDRFYEILRHFKYTTSNRIGSYTFYSVEMGMPFSLLGEKASYVNHTNPGFSVGPINLSEPDLFKEVTKLFRGLHSEISPEQRDFVTTTLGIGEGLGAQEVKNILWDAYRKRGDWGADIKLAIKNKIKHWREMPVTNDLYGGVNPKWRENKQ